VKCQYVVYGRRNMGSKSVPVFISEQRNFLVAKCLIWGLVAQARDRTQGRYPVVIVSVDFFHTAGQIGIFLRAVRTCIRHVTAAGRIFLFFFSLLVKDPGGNCEEMKVYKKLLSRPDAMACNGTRNDAHMLLLDDFCDESSQSWEQKPGVVPFACLFFYSCIRGRILGRMEDWGGADEVTKMEPGCAIDPEDNKSLIKSSPGEETR
jgi:hypothetical protein